MKSQKVRLSELSAGAPFKYRGKDFRTITSPKYNNYNIGGTKRPVWDMENKKVIKLRYDTQVTELSEKTVNSKK